MTTRTKAQTGMPKKRIAVIGLGGTIAMTQGPNGFVPTAGIADVLAVVPALGELAVFEPIDFLSVGSANIGFDDLFRLSHAIKAVVDDGCAGVVVVQGTDSIDETAFALELLTDVAVPIVVTGAMRAASVPGADGPANILSSVIVALGPAPSPGVFVVLNDEIHAARHVVKAHTASVGAFRSPDIGAMGRVHERRLRWHGASLPRLPLIPLKSRSAWPRVAIMPVAIGDDGAMLRALDGLGYAGCVLQAMGGGHVPAAQVPAIEQLASTMPVVLTSRTGSGRVYEASYGYAGSETDLLARGVITAGALGSYKARVLLTLLLAQDAGAAAARFSEAAALI